MAGLRVKERCDGLLHKDGDSTADSQGKGVPRASYRGVLDGGKHIGSTRETGTGGDDTSGPNEEEQGAVASRCRWVGDVQAVHEHRCHR